jgi:hypothetical protein
MSGSNMFIMYQDGKGNVTISPRAGTFHTPPSLDTTSTAARLTLLAGSGVSSDGKTMTANVVCANCESWSGGGSLSLKSTESSWISAWKSGSSLATTNRNAALTQHDDTALFQLDLTKATLTSDSNPFSSSSDSSSSSGGSSGSSSGGSSSGSSDSSGVVAVAGANNNILYGHGIIMALVMVVLYPLGSLLMPLLGKWLVHAGFQIFSFVLMWLGFGLGIKTAMDRKMVSLTQCPHLQVASCR